MAGPSRFNENLNVLIGGRGTGKSTVIESLRYVLGLGPLGQDAKTAHEGIVKHVLKNGTRIASARCASIIRHAASTSSSARSRTRRS
jgi:chromosome segregation ATPase